jgi:hypothetical protein
MDVHVPAAITRGLLLRGVDVLTAQIDGATRLADPDLLDRATELGRVLFSQDEDLLAEAASRQRTAKAFAGVIYAHQLGITIGQAINELEALSKAGNPGETNPLHTSSRAVCALTSRSRSARWSS